MFPGISEEEFAGLKSPSPAIAWLTLDKIKKAHPDSETVFRSMAEIICTSVESTFKPEHGEERNQRVWREINLWMEFVIDQLASGTPIVVASGGDTNTSYDLVIARLPRGEGPKEEKESKPA